VRSRDDILARMSTLCALMKPLGTLIKDYLYVHNCVHFRFVHAW